jgi:hypothetical protein
MSSRWDTDPALPGESVEHTNQAAEAGVSPAPAALTRFLYAAFVNEGTDTKERGLFGLFEISDELAYLHPEVNALYIVHAIVGVFLFKMCGKFMSALREFHDIGVFLGVEIQAENYSVFFNLRINFAYLVL